MSYFETEYKLTDLQRNAMQTSYEALKMAQHESD